MAYRVTERCTNCGGCLGVCPMEAVSLHDDGTRIDPDLCTDCGTCSDICPERAIEGG